VLAVEKASMAAEAQVGLKDVASQRVVLTLELTEFEKAKDTWSMSEEEKVEFGAARKDMGSSLFKAGRVALALQRYKKVSDLFSYIDNFKPENKDRAKELKQLSELNRAACHLKLQEFAEARTACNNVLKEEKQNVKALYRRAQAEYGLKNFLECMRECKSLIEVDPQNREARSLLKQAQVGQKEVDKQTKGLYASMCKALGRGPIPEPGKSKQPFDEDLDGEDEEDANDGGAPVEEAADASQGRAAEGATAEVERNEQQAAAA